MWIRDPLQKKGWRFFAKNAKEILCKKGNNMLPFLIVTFFAKDPFFKRIRSHQLDIETSKAFQQGPEVLRGAKAVGKKSENPLQKRD